MSSRVINYSNTIIYKIVCCDVTIKECYVGHTTNFTQRKSAHKYNSKVSVGKLYKFIKENKGWDNFNMVEIEKFPCMNDNEARARERHWFEQLNSNLNTYTQMINIEECKKKLQTLIEPTVEQQSIPLTEDRKEYMHQYWLKNLNKRNAQNKKNYQLNKEERKEYSKEYFQENKEIIMLQRNSEQSIKQYQTDYKNKLVVCCCKKEMKSNYYYTHRKKCESYIKNNEPVTNNDIL
jgi:hypothetical protein